MSNRWKVVSLLIMTTLIIIILSLLNNMHNFNNKNHSIIISNFNTSLIKISYPKKKKFLNRIYWIGKVISKKRVDIVALINGIITKRYVRNGEYVRKGDPLFYIGGENIKCKLKYINNQIKLIKKNIKIQKSLIYLKKMGLKDGFVNKSDFLIENEKLLDLKTKLYSLEKELTFLKNCRILRSPINGIFINSVAFVGQYVKKFQHLGDILSKDLIIIAKIPTSTPLTMNGKDVIIEMNNGLTLDAKVYQTMYNRTSLGEELALIKVNNKSSNLLMPNQYVSGWIILGVHTAISIPENSIIYTENDKKVVFIKKGKRYEKRIVKTGIARNGWIEILSGISKDDKVVISGAYELFFKDFAKNYKVPD